MKSLTHPRAMSAGGGIKLSILGRLNVGNAERAEGIQGKVQCSHLSWSEVDYRRNIWPFGAGPPAYFSTLVILILISSTRSFGGTVSVNRSVKVWPSTLRSSTDQSGGVYGCERRLVGPSHRLHWNTSSG